MQAAIKSPSLNINMGRAAKATGLFLLFLVGLMLAFPSHAVTAFDGTIGGPLADAMTQFASMGNGVKALIGFIGFVVALISLASLRNMGPVLFFIGLAVFGAVGLSVAGTIMGAGVSSLAVVGAL